MYMFTYDAVGWGCFDRGKGVKGNHWGLRLITGLCYLRRG